MSIIITKQPASCTSVRLGAEFTLEVTLQDVGSATYAWYKVGSSTPIDGQTTKTLTIASMKESDFGAYFCRISKDGEVQDTQKCLAVKDSSAPTITITRQPQAVAVDVDAQVTLTCEAETNERVMPLQYSWVHNNVTVEANKPNGTLTITHSTLDTAGEWLCLVSCGETIVNSHVVKVTVNDVPFVRITKQPADLTAAENTSADFSVEVLTNRPSLLTYAWQKNGAPIESAVSAPDVVLDTVTSGDNSAKIKCIVTLTGTGKSATSDEATLTVGAALAVTYSVQPQSAGDLLPGSVVQLSATASANDDRYPVTYQWYKDDVAIEGATNSTLQLTMVDNTIAGAYHVMAAAGPASHVVRTKSDVANLTAKVGQVDLQISAHPTRNVDVASGVMFVLSVTATTDSPLGIQYQWSKNGRMIEGATSNTLVFASPGPSDSGTYKCRLVAGSGTWKKSLDSEQSDVVVTNNKAININISQEPQTQQKMMNEYVELSVTATTDGYPLQYQWYKDGVKLAHETDAKLRFVLNAQKTGKYHVVCTSGGYTKKSADATITMAPCDKIVITEQPTTKFVQYDSYSPMTLKVTASDATYEWYKDGQAIGGQTNATYQVDDVPEDSAHYYQVKVTSQGQSMLTKPAWMLGISAERQMFVHALPHRNSSFMWSRYEITDFIKDCNARKIAWWQAMFPDEPRMQAGVDTIVYAMSTYGKVEVMESRNGRVLTFDDISEAMVPTDDIS